MGRQPCCERVGLKRGPWTMEEDSKLMNFILNNGIQCWRLVPKLAGLMRCGKSCRLRWINYLRPDLKRGAFTEAEEDMIIQLHSRLGNRWSKIASHFPGRTDNEIKNHWNTRIKKKMKLMGLDPLTHKPLTIHQKNDEEIIKSSSDTHEEMVHLNNLLEFQENHVSNYQILQQQQQQQQQNTEELDRTDYFVKSFEMGSPMMFQNRESLGNLSVESFQGNWMMDSNPFMWDGFTSLEPEDKFLPL